MLQNVLSELKALARRLEQEVLASEAEKVQLRKRISELEQKLASLDKPAKEPRLHDDCANCLYRLMAQGKLDKERG